MRHRKETTRQQPDSLVRTKKGLLIPDALLMKWVGNQNISERCVGMLYILKTGFFPLNQVHL